MLLLEPARPGAWRGSRCLGEAVVECRRRCGHARVLSGAGVADTRLVLVCGLLGCHRVAELPFGRGPFDGLVRSCVLAEQLLAQRGGVLEGCGEAIAKHDQRTGVFRLDAGDLESVAAGFCHGQAGADGAEGFGVAALPRSCSSPTKPACRQRQPVHRGELNERTRKVAIPPECPTGIGAPLRIPSPPGRV